MREAAAVVVRIMGRSYLVIRLFLLSCWIFRVGQNHRAAWPAWNLVAPDRGSIDLCVHIIEGRASDFA